MNFTNLAVYLFITSLALLHASKRPPLDPIAGSERPAKRVRRELFPPLPIENDPSPLDVLMPELIAYIFAHLLDDFPLHPTKNPLAALRLVSPKWNAIIDSPLFFMYMKANPQTAHYLLFKSKQLSTTLNWDLFKACKNILSDNDRLELMMTAEDVQSLDALARIGRLSDIAVDSYELQYLSLSFTLNCNLPIYETTHFDHRYRNRSSQLIIASLNSHPSSSFLFMHAQTDIIRLLFLDDMRNPRDFTWIYELFMKSFCKAYHSHPDFRAHLKRWSDDFAQVRLPNVQRNLLYECLEWPLLLAAMTGDLDFIKMIAINFEEEIANPEKSKGRDSLFQSYIQIQKGLRKTLLPSAYSELDHIFSDRSTYGPLGFDERKALNALDDFIPHLNDHRAISRAHEFKKMLRDAVNDEQQL